MAGLRVCCAFVLSLLAVAAAVPAAGQPAATPGLFDRPVLVIDPGMHTAKIDAAGAATDAGGRWAVTGSDDKTLRVWQLADGALLRTIRLPAGPGNIGMIYAVAMSPDGALIAAGGWTRWSDADPQEQIYLFDRASGAMARPPITGLPSVVDGLAFSPDGRLLAATLGGGRGLRIYARDRGWAEIARDTHYGDQSYGVTFAGDEQLATTSFDGMVRLYSGNLSGDLRPAVAIKAPGGREAYGIAFNPDGTRLAVGYIDTGAVDLLDGHTLAALPGPALVGITGRNLGSVAWSLDGRTLFAAGLYWYKFIPGRPVFAWSEAGTGARRVLAAATDTVMALMPLPGGDLLVATADPWLARLGPDGSRRWVHVRSIADFRDQSTKLFVSSDGTRIGFGFMDFGKMPARFDMRSLALSLDPPPDSGMAAPRQAGLKIEGWLDTTQPTLNGRPLRLEQYEMSRSLAIDPEAKRFVLGADWSLRGFAANGTPLWTRKTAGVVWAVNITGDGRLVVAAYSDGTIRWHRMSDGVEILAFMPLPDRKNWVAWTPEGFYAASAGIHGMLRWHVNHGWNQPADSVAIEDIPGSYRPAVLPLVLQELETPRALGLALLAEHNAQVMTRTNSRLPPGVKLHLLTIGIDTYEEEYAKILRLKFAERDAHDLAAALMESQRSLYAEVAPQVLTGADANKKGIMRALATMAEQMGGGGGDDLAVVFFSGHGAVVDGALYLLPADVDIADAAGIEASALSIGQLRRALVQLAAHGRVLVLLDACHSGAISANGAQPVDSTALRTELAGANITVLTSSSGIQVSREYSEWQHGAFTEALLDAFKDPAADIDHDGLINPNGLAHYIASRVGSMTDGAQTPGMEIRYDTTLFALGQ